MTIHTVYKALPDDLIWFSQSWCEADKASGFIPILQIMTLGWGHGEGQVACPRSHGQSVTKLGLEPGSPNCSPSALPTSSLDSEDLTWKNDGVGQRPDR